MQGCESCYRARHWRISNKLQQLNNQKIADLYKCSTACGHHASYVKTKISQTTPSSFCGRIAMQSEGRPQHMEPFSVSYSMRLYQHAQKLNSCTIFCYRVLYFLPLSPRFGNKIVVGFVGPNHCQSEFRQHTFPFPLQQIQKKIRNNGMPFFILQAAPSRNIQRRCFELLHNHFLPYSYHSSPWIILTFQNTESKFWDMQITSELQSLHSETRRLSLSYRVYSLRFRVYSLR